MKVINYVSRFFFFLFFFLMELEDPVGLIVQFSEFFLA